MGGDTLNVTRMVPLQYQWPGCEGDVDTKK